MNKRKVLITLILAGTLGLLGISLMSVSGNDEAFEVHSTSKEPEIIKVIVEPVSTHAVEMLNIDLDGKITWKDSLGKEHTNVYTLERAWSELHLTFQLSDSGIELDETLHDEVIRLLKQHYGESHTYVIV